MSEVATVDQSGGRASRCDAASPRVDLRRVDPLAFRRLRRIRRHRALAVRIHVPAWRSPPSACAAFLRPRHAASDRLARHVQRGGLLSLTSHASVSAKASHSSRSRSISRSPLCSLPRSSPTIRSSGCAHPLRLCRWPARRGLPRHSRLFRYRGPRRAFHRLRHGRASGPFKDPNVLGPFLARRSSRSSRTSCIKRDDDAARLFCRC